MKQPDKVVRVKPPLHNRFKVAAAELGYPSIGAMLEAMKLPKRHRV